MTRSAIYPFVYWTPPFGCGRWGVERRARKDARRVEAVVAAVAAARNIIGGDGGG